MIKTFEQFNRLYEGLDQENVIKDFTLYNNFPKDEDKPNMSWEEAIEIIRNSKYNVKCAFLGVDNDNRYNWSAPYEFEYKNKKICICEGVIEYTIKYKNRRRTFLILPLNEDGRKIKRANVEILGSKYLIRIESDILDGYDVESVENRYINKILKATSKEDIDVILNNAFKATTQKQYSTILASSLCREIEIGIWEPTDIDGKGIIKSIGERFGLDYFKE